MTNITGIIYLIINEITKKLYIGQTINFERRMKDHQNKKGDSSPVHKSIKKHGWENFSIIKLHENVPVNDLNWLEKHCILIFNTLYPDGYNKKYGASGNSYYKKTLIWERKAEIIEKYLSGYSLNDLSKELECSHALIRNILIANNVPRRTEYIDRHTDQVKAKISKSSTGKKHSEESKKRMSDRNHERLYHIDGKQLKLWRKQNNLSRKDLSKWVGCSSATIQNWELDRTSMTRSLYLKFIDVFEFDPTQKFKVV